MKLINRDNYLMKKIINFLILICLMFYLSGCKQKPQSYLNKIEERQNIKYLVDAEVLFFFENVGGFDSSGICYFVLSYENKNIDFLSQFDYQNIEGIKDENVKEVKQGRNYEFEEKVNELINNFMKEEYETFDDMYKIDWNEKYSYLNDTPPMTAVDCPMIYFEDSATLIIVKLQM